MNLSLTDNAIEAAARVIAEKVDGWTVWDGSLEDGAPSAFQREEYRLAARATIEAALRAEAPEDTCPWGYHPPHKNGEAPYWCPGPQPECKHGSAIPHEWMENAWDGPHHMTCEGPQPECKHDGGLDHYSETHFHCPKCQGIFPYQPESLTEFPKYALHESWCSGMHLVDLEGNGECLSAELLKQYQPEPLTDDVVEYVANAVHLGCFDDDTKPNDTDRAHARIAIAAYNSFCDRMAQPAVTRDAEVDESKGLIAKPLHMYFGDK